MKKCPFDCAYYSNCALKARREASAAASDRCRFYFVDPNRRKTNYEKIKAMSVDELALFITEFSFCNFGCAEGKRLENEPLLKGEKCDERCAEHCKRWLESEVKT